jgi:hypothetical protein
MPTVQERLATIETKLDYICKNIEEISTNHLPHIYKRLEALEKCNAVNKSWTRFAKPILTGVAVSAISVVLTYFFTKIC